LSSLGRVFDDLAVWLRDQRNRLGDEMRKRAPDEIYEREYRDALLISEAARHGRPMREIAELASDLGGKAKR
jgi:hypothetical protein